MPKPYLALAPSPISSLSPRRIDQLAAPSSSRSGLVLPSTINRTASTPNLAAGYQEAGRRGSAPNAQDVASGLVNNARVAAEGRRRGYAAGLMAPPAIMPGGIAAPPRTQGLAVPPQNPRKRSAERVGVGGSNTSPQIVTLSGTGIGSGSGNGIGRRRSEDRLRDIANLNSSMMSLGQLGRIMEADPPAEPATQAQPPERRRRRRVVRGEEGGLTRRPTVSSREEGRALGLARSASMRRTNVWDGTYGLWIQQVSILIYRLQICRSRQIHRLRSHFQQRRLLGYLPLSKRKMPRHLSILHSGLRYPHLQARRQYPNRQLPHLRVSNRLSAYYPYLTLPQRLLKLRVPPLQLPKTPSKHWMKNRVLDLHSL